LANSLGWQRDLQDPLRSSTRVGELLGGEEAAAPQPAEDGDRRTLDALVADLVAVPFAPQEHVVWGSRSRPSVLTCVIRRTGRRGMIVSRVLASALLGLLSAGESAVVARPLVGV
jgi:hypothetical protein